MDAPSWRPLKEVSSTTQESEPTSRPPSIPVPEEEEQVPTKLRFALDQARPAGAEVSTGDESLLELFADDGLSSVSAIPSDHSDDEFSTFTTGAWDDDDEEQP